MKMRFVLSVLFCCVQVFAQSSNKVVKVRVSGDRVSLRARPSVDSELLDRAMRGEEFVLKGRTNDWVAIQAPDTIDCWVSGEYLVDGVVRPKKLNVRSGPSLNYSVIAVLHKGDKLSPRGEFNGWIKVAPPEGSQVWISEKYVDIVEPVKPKPKVEKAPVVEEKVVKKAPPIPPAPPLTEAEKKPLLLVLDKEKPQGEYTEIPGVLRRANPGLYKLVLITEVGEEPICLVRGEHNQMERYLNRSMLIKGKKYWIKGSDIPLVQPLKIHLDPIIED